MVALPFRSDLTTKCPNTPLASGSGSASMLLALAGMLPASLQARLPR